MPETVYRCSNGRFYGDVDLWERLESGQWRPCCWDEDSGTEWVYTADDDMLSLTPVAPSALPSWLSRTRTEGGVRVEPDRSEAGRAEARR